MPSADEASSYSQIVYSPYYNITACGFEKAHPFDSTKYRRIVEFLNEDNILSDELKIFEPWVPSRAFLR
jgi:histone deacetylase 11